MSSPSILWITLESLRWDHTTFAGHERSTTPNLQDLASQDDGFVSDQCYSHGIYTRSSTASILTGRAPSNHGVGMYRSRLPESIDTIPRQLADQGYWNICISPNGHISEATGLDRGFDEFRFITSSTIRKELPYRSLGKYLLNIYEHSGGLTTETSHHSISYLKNQLASRYLKQAQNKTDPLFLYMHYGDSHHPYVPPISWREEFSEDLSMSVNEAIEVATDMKENILKRIARGSDFSDQEWNAIRVLYDTLVAYVDHMIGQIIDEAIELLDDPIIVVTGDHGEHFGERGLIGHRLGVTRTLTNVPLLIYGLDVEVSRRDTVQHADIWKLLSDKINAEIDAPVAVNPSESPREYAVVQKGGERTSKNLDKIQDINPKFSREEFYERDLTALVGESWIYYRPTARSAGALVSVDEDRTAIEDPEREEKLDLWYREWYEENGHPVQTNDDTEERAVENEVKENLKNMGYLVE